MKACPKCLKQARDGSKICRECGSILEEIDDQTPLQEDMRGQSAQVSATEKMQGSPIQTTTLIDNAEDTGTLCGTCDDQDQMEHVEVPPWTCNRCGEQVPGTFDICWKCEADKEGLDDCEFVTGSPDMDETDQQENNSDDAIPTESQGELDCGIERLRCPDCDGSMHQIRIIDKGGNALSHHDLEYAAPDAERSFWIQQYPVAGKIISYMCQECGAVRLFGRAID